MKLGSNQPYFFPYLGYFSLIKSVDKWIVFDPVQNIRHGWIERNRILKPQEGWQYISVPLVKHPYDTLIKDVMVRNTEDWKGKLFRQLEHYKKKSPFYKDVIELLHEMFKYEAESITKLNTHLLAETCKYLNINFNYVIFSESTVPIEPAKLSSDEWALNSAKAFGCDHYINSISGIDIYDRSKFEAAGVKLSFIKVNLKEYDQKRPVFESGLSVLDAMMFCSPLELNQMLDDYQLV